MDVTATERNRQRPAGSVSNKTRYILIQFQSGIHIVSWPGSIYGIELQTHRRHRLRFSNSCRLQHTGHGRITVAAAVTWRSTEATNQMRAEDFLNAYE